jgi:hypothetical protein
MCVFDARVSIRTRCQSSHRLQKLSIFVSHGCCEQNKRTDHHIDKRAYRYNLTSHLCATKHSVRPCIQRGILWKTDISARLINIYGKRPVSMCSSALYAYVKRSVNFVILSDAHGKMLLCVFLVCGSHIHWQSLENWSTPIYSMR